MESATAPDVLSALAAGVSELAGGVAGVGEVDLRESRHVFAVDPAAAVPEGLNDIFEPMMREHPLLPPAGMSMPLSIRFSDLLSLNQLRRLRIFQEVYRPLGFERFTVSMLNLGRPGRLFFLAFGRSGLDFTDGEKALVGLASSHALAAYRVSHLRPWLDGALKALERIDDTAYGVVILGAFGRVQLANGAARVMLREYFARRCREGDLLPDELATWWARQRSLPNRDDPHIGEVFTVSHGERRLSVSFVGDGPEALLLTESGVSDPASPPPTVDSLTRRQTEILWLAAHGFTSVRIARRLGISPRTVDSHLAQAYLKLGVANRSAAVLRAFGLRGIRRPSRMNGSLTGIAGDGTAPAR